MPTFIAGLFLLYLLLAAIKRFGRLTPADAAKLMRKSGAALGVAGLALTLMRGRLGLFGALASAFVGWASKQGGPFQDIGGRARGARSTTARSAWLEMRLDLDSGAMQGRAIAGPQAGKELDALGREELVELYRACLGGDPEGARLLETYLDRRLAGWREADQGEAQGRRGGRSFSSGALTRDEAYEILGLPKGASAEEIIRAHRVLMKKLHPDHGGSTALAARVNQAKDVLLDRHG